MAEVIWSKTLQSLFGSQSTGFRYDRLTGAAEIRVLDLHPGKKDSEISCSLRHISLNDPTVSYTALSYVWGPIEPLRLVTCSGQSKRVTPNLHSLLTRLQRSDKQQTLWVDAICINQGDAKERSHQVTLMGRIYKQAALTIADLGEWEGELDSLNETLPKALNMMRQSDPPPKLSQSLLEEYELPAASHPAWQRILSIYTRPWFRRIWILQEYVLSSQVDFLLGSDLTPSQDFAGLLHVFVDTGIIELAMNSLAVAERDNVKLSFKAYQNMLTSRENFVLGKPKPLLRLLIDSRSCHASDPRDKIFALHSLASDVEHLSLLVDYTRSSREVFQKTAQALLERDHALEILLEAGGEWSSMSHYFRVPNWVPNWGRYQRHGPGLVPEDSKLGYGKVSHGAAGASSAKLRFLSNTKLAIQGAVIDEVVAAGGDILSDTEDLSLTDWTLFEGLFDFEQAANDLMRTLHSYPTGEPVLEAYCRTLTLNSVRPDHAKVDTRSLVDAYTAFLSFRKLCNHRKDSLFSILTKAILAPMAPYEGMQIKPADKPAADRAFKNASTFMNGFTLAAESRRFFVTRKGYIGLGIGAGKGDMVCVFGGSPVPFLLHPGFVELDVYTLMGPCYVHGVMHGEALAMGDYREQEIVMD